MTTPQARLTQIITGMGGAFLGTMTPGERHIAAAVEWILGVDPPPTLEELADAREEHLARNQRYLEQMTDDDKGYARRRRVAEAEALAIAEERLRRSQ